MHTKIFFAGKVEVLFRNKVEMILHMQHKASKEQSSSPCHHFEPCGWGLAIATRAIMILQ